MREIILRANGSKIVLQQPRLQAAVRGSAPEHPLYPQQQTLAHRRPLFRGLRPVYPQQRA